MDHKLCIILVQVLLSIQVNKSDARYCQEAVASADFVESCPTSKIEWDTAARRKNCSRIASKQNCSAVEKFKYHCVINGFRNETLEVCAPSRIIFGHCVEFNLLGGVIQDQMSTPCEDFFPKCDSIYNSTEAFKYPDCYKLVSMSWNHPPADKKRKIKDITTTTGESVSQKSMPTMVIVLIPAISLATVALYKARRLIPGRTMVVCIKSRSADAEEDNKDDTLPSEMTVLTPD